MESSVAVPPHAAWMRREDSVSEARKRRREEITVGVRALSRSAAEDDNEFKRAVRDFCLSTTLHGLPMVLGSKSIFVRIFWTVFSIGSFILCAMSCYDVFQKFAKKEKIVNVELEFESAAFPAITLCNLNPFKNRMARSVHEIRETLDAFHQAVTYSLDANLEEEGRRRRRDLEKDGFQEMGGFRYVQYEPVMSDCECPRGTADDCIQKDSVPDTYEKSCICNFDRTDGSPWPCYLYETWEHSKCPGCNDVGFCNIPNTTAKGNEQELHACVCNTNVGYCLLQSAQRMRRVWEFRGKAIPKKGSPFRSDFLEQLKELGYENMTDQVAITTQTKERLILKMAALPKERRIALSYGKAELIKMCSFNGHQCDIEKDFRLHTDHTFGNCYTFNANPNTTFVSSRAGPSYGLRLMVFVNASDYLPTTDAIGVRLAIHGQKESPFPDTFGYSAPTGIVSSFGLSLRKVNRLNNTEGGDCVPPERPLPASYIYRKYAYEPEGCWKSCYQMRIIRVCACYDPRLPSPDNARIRPCIDTVSSACLLNEAARLTKLKSSTGCKCKQPCQQDVYSTTYSAAKWPSGSLNMACQSSGDCIQYYREHAAMIEIYYEQMSYEVIRETQSYQFVNAVSDIGGQAGLWLGASILTLVEFVVLLMRLLKLFITKYDLTSIRGKKRKMEAARAAQRPHRDHLSHHYNNNNNNNNNNINYRERRRRSLPSEGRADHSISNPIVIHNDNTTIEEITTDKKDYGVIP